MKKNTGAIYLALGLKCFLLERPHVLRTSKCHIWLVPELLFVLSWGSFLFLFSFFFVCLFFLFVCFTSYLNVWRGIGLFYCIDWFVVHWLMVYQYRYLGEKRRRRRKKRLGTFAPKTHWPCSMAHVNSLLRGREHRRTCSWHVYRRRYAVWRNVTLEAQPVSKTHLLLVIFFLFFFVSLWLPEFFFFFFFLFRTEIWPNM